MIRFFEVFVCPSAVFAPNDMGKHLLIGLIIGVLLMALAIRNAYK